MILLVIFSCFIVTITGLLKKYEFKLISKDVLVKNIIMAAAITLMTSAIFIIQNLELF